MTLDRLNLTDSRGGFGRSITSKTKRMAQSSSQILFVIRPVVRRRRHRVFGIADVTVVRRVPYGIDEQRRRGQRDQVPSVESF